MNSQKEKISDGKKENEGKELFEFSETKKSATENLDLITWFQLDDRKGTQLKKEEEKKTKKIEKKEKKNPR